MCDLTLYKVGERTTAWGLKCGRDYEDNKVKGKNKRSKLELLFNGIFSGAAVMEQTRPLTIGLTKGLYQAEFFPLFKDFFQRVGCEVVLEESSEYILKQGNKMVNSDFCAPIVMVHGMVDKLLKKGVDCIFLPALVNEKSLLDKDSNDKIFREKVRDSYFCYYSSYAPSIVYNVLKEDDREKIVAPNLYFDDSSPEELADIIASSLEELLSEDKKYLSDQFLKSLDYFRLCQMQWKMEGEKVIESNKDKMKIMLLGRPYTIFDKQINLGIPAKLEEIGFDLLYQSMVDTGDSDCPVTSKFLEKMHWFYGQEILQAAEMAAKSDNIYPVFLSCFRITIFFIKVL